MGFWLGRAARARGELSSSEWADRWRRRLPVRPGLATTPFPAIWAWLQTSWFRVSIWWDAMALSWQVTRGSEQVPLSQSHHRWCQWLAFQVGPVVKNPSANAGEHRGHVNPRWGRSPGGGMATGSDVFARIPGQRSLAEKLPWSHAGCKGQTRQTLNKNQQRRRKRLNSGIWAWSMNW